MEAEIIAIGDELTSGQRLDTNSQWLAWQLGQIGVRVLFHTTVADELSAGEQVFRQAVDRADLIVSTGGLGPTADDLTRESIAAATGRALELEPAALDHIRRLFARRQRPMPERNTVQAMFPRGSRVIPNPHGTAPGIDLEVPRPGRSPARIFALPGVPAEMRQMWEQTVLPALEAQQGGTRCCLRHRCIKCFGVGESDLEAMLPDLIRRGREPQVGITVSRATISLRITAAGESPEVCDQRIAPTVETIRQCLGDLIFGEGEEELQDAVVRMLAQRRQTLATAECDAGGQLAHWLGEADPRGEIVLGGVVVRRPRQTRWDGGAGPGGPADPADDRQLVACLAERCRQQFAADWGLALGPFPAVESDAAQPSQVHMALASPDGTRHRAVIYAGHPDLLNARTVKQTLDFLRLTLLHG